MDGFIPGIFLASLIWFFGFVVVLMFMIPETAFVEYKIKHGCSYYDSVTGKLVDREKCEEPK